MALYHFHVTQIKRSEGRTAVASAAYRAGEKLHNLWDGETHELHQERRCNSCRNYAAGICTGKIF